MSHVSTTKGPTHQILGGSWADRSYEQGQNLFLRFQTWADFQSALDFCALQVRLVMDQRFLT